MCGSSDVPVDTQLTQSAIQTDNALKLIGDTELTQTDYAVVMSRDHQLDFEIADELLKQNPRFIGMIGSRTKWGRFEAHMASRGSDPTAIKAVHCPVGLDIAALTPKEIAVSVVSQLIDIRRGGARWS
tara:strand:- start:354 stop:737 length:384 start_codon:yes stop_codon:yes gene_type:complete